MRGVPIMAEFIAQQQQQHGMIEESKPSVCSIVKVRWLPALELAKAKLIWGAFLFFLNSN